MSLLRQIDRDECETGRRGPGTLGAAAARHYDHLLRFVRRHVGAHDEAADIVQDAFVRLTSAVGRSDVRNPGAFLHVAARNLIRDRARTAAVRRASEVAQAATTEVSCPCPSVERTMIAQQELLILERALAELPAKRRAALVLYRFDGMSHAAIAEHLGLSISMVEKHIRHALDHCRRRLADASSKSAK